MESISLFMPKFEMTAIVKQKDHRSERGDLITEFCDRVNAERVGTTYPPLTVKAVAIKIGHIPTKDLYFLMDICKKSASFGKTFFGSIKPKK